MNKRLLFIVNVDWFFLSHRIDVALAAQREGYQVHIAVGITDHQELLESHDLHVHPLKLKRGYSGLLSELRAFFEIRRLMRAVQPDLVHLVTIKPVIYGALALRFQSRVGIVCAISGLGHLFVIRGMFSRVRRALIAALYRLALSAPKLLVIFQNQDDRKLLCKLTGLRESQTRMIKGSGVDLKQFQATDPPPGSPKVVLASRFIADKGIWDFVRAATLLKARKIDVVLCLVGFIDTDNPTSLTENDLLSIRQDGLVEIWGKRSDMARVFSQASIVVLPSFYAEGLPKVLMEAAASGRPVITTNTPGCRDAIDDGVTGLLVPPRSSVALAAAIEKLVIDHELRLNMGQAARAKAVREFDIKTVVQLHLQAYQAVLSADGPAPALTTNGRT